jgi:hypothetical protein
MRRTSYHRRRERIVLPVYELKERREGFCALLRIVKTDPGYSESGIV